MNKNFVIVLLSYIFCVGCVNQKVKIKGGLARVIAQAEEFKNSNLGLLIVDPKSKETIFSQNAEKYFVPASNMKIVTLYAALKTLGDSLPAFKYIENRDEINIAGTGDPTFLHPDFANRKSFDFLHKYKKITLSLGNFQNKSSWGAGWTLDDYNEAYQVETSALPIYGNVVQIKNEIKPPIFKNYFINDGTENAVIRDLDKNTFHYKTLASSQCVPFKINNGFLSELMTDTLKSAIVTNTNYLAKMAKTFYAMPSDTVYRRMMQLSDNMLAEQLLLMVGNELSDTLSTEVAIKNITYKYLQNLPQKIKWVDGSGLSRYNLITPASIVKILDDMLTEIPQKRLFSLMAIGGQTGTLKNSYVSNPPYVFAKTGSMKGVYNQSGYIITKSGRLLIFSVMNNNFIASLSKMRLKTNEIMNWVRDNY